MSKDFTKVKEEANEEDDIYFINEIKPDKKTNSPIILNKLPHKQFNVDKKKETSDPCLVNLMDYKRELIEDDGENLLHQFSQEQDVAYDSDDDETVFHKSAIDDDRQETVFSCKKLNNNISDESEDDSCVILDDDEETKFMKENEIILSNVTKKLQEYIDLTGDDNDDDDGFLPIQIKQEPNTSPIVIKEKKISSSNCSLATTAEVKTEKASPQSHLSKQPIKSSYVNKPIISTQNSTASNSSSDDIQLSILAAQYEKSHFIRKISSDDEQMSILAAEYEQSHLEKKTTIIELKKKPSEEESNDSSIDLFYDALNKGIIKETGSLLPIETKKVKETKSLLKEKVDNTINQRPGTSASFSQESKHTFILFILK